MSSSIDPLLTIIQKEVTVVTSTMRRNQRFDITNQQRNQRIKRLDYDYIQDANQQGSSTLSHVLNYSKSQRSFIGYAVSTFLYRNILF